MRDFFHTGLNVSRSDLEDIGLKIKYPGGIWYVSRNRGSISGDGRSWDQAFLTFKEAITAVNLAYSTAAYPTRGRNTLILIDEGWYAEVPITLTASDVHMLGCAPGSHDSTVLYGVPVAGTFSGVAGGNALTVKGSNCTFENFGVYVSDPLYASIADGHHTGDIGGYGQMVNYNNKFIDMSFIRDGDDGSLGGLDLVSAEGPIVRGCRFSTSCKDFGIRIRSNGSVNPVGVSIRDCEFVGCDIGVLQVAGHQTRITENVFWDDTTDRPGVMSNPCHISGSSAYMYNNWAPSNTLAEFNGGAVGIQKGNICSDSDETNWPADA